MAQTLDPDPDQLATIIDGFVVATGRALGRLRVKCEGSEPMTDPDYPVPSGRLDVWGFDILGLSLKSPSTNSDYMSYCYPTWVSAYAWTREFFTLNTLISWDFDAPPDPGGTLLRGHLYAGGRADWNLIPGGLAGSTGGPGRVEFVTGEGAVIGLPAAIEETDGGSTLVTVAIDEQALAGLKTAASIDLIALFSPELTALGHALPPTPNKGLGRLRRLRSLSNSRGA